MPDNQRRILALPGEEILCPDCGAVLATLTDEWLYRGGPTGRPAPFRIEPAGRKVMNPDGSGTIWCNCGGAPSRPFGYGKMDDNQGFRMFMRSEGRTFWRMLGGE